MTQAALIALITTCISSMQGNHFVGNPSNLPVMKGYQNACASAADDLSRRRTFPNNEMKRREILAIVLDREVLISYAGLNDAKTALPAARAELLNLGELLKVAKDPNEIGAFEQQAELVGGEIQTLRSALKQR